LVEPKPDEVLVLV